MANLPSNCAALLIVVPSLCLVRIFLVCFLALSFPPPTPQYNCKTEFYHLVQPSKSVAQHAATYRNFA